MHSLQFDSGEDHSKWFGAELMMEYEAQRKASEDDRAWENVEDVEVVQTDILNSCDQVEHLHFRAPHKCKHYSVQFKWYTIGFCVVFSE